jgi:hypothetical protein
VFALADIVDGCGAATALPEFDLDWDPLNGPSTTPTLLARVLMARTITLNIAMTTRPTNEEASDERGGRAVHADDDSGDYAALRVEPCRDVSALLVLKERASCAARATSRAGDVRGFHGTRNNQSCCRKGTQIARPMTPPRPSSSRCCRCRFYRCDE